MAVQHVTGMWVLRGMRMKAYFSAIKVETADAAKYGSLGAALIDAQHLVVGSPVGCVAIAKPKRRGSTETTVMEWAREVEQRYMATGRMWAMQGVSWSRHVSGLRATGILASPGALSAPCARAIFSVRHAKYPLGQALMP